MTCGPAVLPARAPARALKIWLSPQRICYQEKDLNDPAAVADAKVRYGVRVAPIAVVGAQSFYGTFADQGPKLVEALDPATAP